MLTVSYILDEKDSLEINRRRRDERDGPWHQGIFTHVGNRTCPGEIYPAIIVKRWSERLCNLQVFLDGNDVLWVTSRESGTIQGRWFYGV